MSSITKTWKDENLLPGDRRGTEEGMAIEIGYTGGEKVIIWVYV